MKQRKQQTYLSYILRRTLRRAPLPIFLAVLGLLYLAGSAFGLYGGAADPSRVAVDYPPVSTESQLSTSTCAPTTDAPTTEAPTTAAQTTEAPTTEAPTTEAPTTAAPTTEPPTTEAPTTEAPTTEARNTEVQTGRTIYLTFDDGPCNNTRRVLEILDQYGVTATFFTVGYYVDHFPETTAMIEQQGSLIACHSYTHDYDACYASVDAFFSEMDRWKQAVKNACGSLPDRICVRFPGGSTTPNAKNVSAGIKARLEEEGYHWFDWNAADNDKYPQGNTKKLSQTEYFWESYLETIGWYKDEPNAQVVFLTHDSEIGTVEILPRMIEDLLSRGYTFKTLDQHPDWDD